MNVFIGVAGLAASMFILPLVCFAGAQTEKADNTEIPKAQTIVQEKLLEVDRQLAKKASQEGILHAFYPVLAKEAVLFPGNGHPVIGPVGCAAAIKQDEADGMISKKEWEPLLAGISAQEDLAYTHGRYSRGHADPELEDKLGYGYYATIWKKSKTGDWQIVVSLGLIDLDFMSFPPLDMKKKVTISKANASTAEVIKTELDFAKLAREKGTNEAFYSYIADTGLALSFNGPPSTKEFYRQFMEQPHPEKKPDVKMPVLAWEPYYSFVSGSKDMAYNYGPYTFTVFDKEGNQFAAAGYFVTVWQRQSDNTWKFVLDGGNTCRHPD